MDAHYSRNGAVNDDFFEVTAQVLAHHTWYPDCGSGLDWCNYSGVFESCGGGIVQMDLPKGFVSYSLEAATCSFAVLHATLQ